MEGGREGSTEGREAGREVRRQGGRAGRAGQRGVCSDFQKLVLCCYCTDQTGVVVL